MSGRMAGKLALITGAAGGIGSAIARSFAREGAQVMVTDLDGNAAEALVEAVNKDYPGALCAAQQDVTDPKRWDQIIDEVDARLGGLSVLVNNAGVWTTGTVEETEDEAWERGLKINLDSVFYGTKRAMRLLRDKQPASIVNLSSIAGLIAGHNIASYNVAKAGVWMLTKSTALYAARKGWDVRCNSIHPFFIDTGFLEDVFSRDGSRHEVDDEQRAKLAKQTPLGRLGTPDDVAYAAIYLASDESHFMTGSELKIDGGISAM
ncbi:MAG: glucose 1-dehydrogenase [Pseudomonadota bacterium]